LYYGSRSKADWEAIAFCIISLQRTMEAEQGRKTKLLCLLFSGLLSPMISYNPKTEKNHILIVGSTH
jgi:hypothetical protein